MFSEKWTDEKLAELEERIAKEYEQAYKELKKKGDAYFKKFKKRYEKEYQAYLDGHYTKQQFDMWVYAQLGRGRRWELLRDTMAERVTKANEVAAKYINDLTPTIFSLNANFEAFIAEGSHAGVSFALISEDTVKRLMTKDRKLLPKRKIDVPKDKKWNQKKLQSALLQGILQGDTTEQIAKRFKRVTDMNQSSAIRNARTAVTGAMNAGTHYTMNEAYLMGIEDDKYWLATKDLKTRTSHQRLDGEHVPLSEKFSNGLRYPGDPDGKPEEVYNCRCTLTSRDRIQVTKRKSRVGNPEYLALGETDDERRKKQREIEKETGRYIPNTVVVNEMNYKEWLEWKSKSS